MIRPVSTLISTVSATTKREFAAHVFGLFLALANKRSSLGVIGFQAIRKPTFFASATCQFIQSAPSSLPARCRAATDSAEPRFRRYVSNESLRYRTVSLVPTATAPPTLSEFSWYGYLFAIQMNRFPTA